MSEKTFTQEEVNALVGEARAKGREAGKKEALEQMGDYEDIKKANLTFAERIEELTNSLSEANNSLESNAQELGELRGKVKNYETDSVKLRTLHELGLPYELKGNVFGETEEEIRNSAGILANVYKSNRNPSPLADPEGTPSGEKDKTQLYKGMLETMSD